MAASVPCAWRRSRAPGWLPGSPSTSPGPRAVVDRAGLQVALGHPEGLLDLEQLVVGADDELGGDRGAVRAGPQVGGVARRRTGHLPSPRCRLLASATVGPQDSCISRDLRLHPNLQVNVDCSEKLQDLPRRWPDRQRPAPPLPAHTAVLALGPGHLRGIHPDHGPAPAMCQPPRPSYQERRPPAGRGTGAHPTRQPGRHPTPRTENQDQNSSRRAIRPARHTREELRLRLRTLAAAASLFSSLTRANTRNRRQWTARPTAR
jgi:hypothetical protein